MNFFKKIVKTLSDSDVKLEANKKALEDIKNSDVQASTNDGDKDFKMLLALYKKNKADDVDIVSLVKEGNPEATDHKCPYCSVVHEFKASRARKCPDCSKKMIVRQGLFITEDQAKKLEKKIQDFYNRQDNISQSGFSIEAAQNYHIDKDLVGYYRSIAESFRFMASVENQKDDKGFSFWDKAWNYYNLARLEEMKNLTKDMMEYSQLPEIFWDMSKMLLDQSKCDNKEKSKKRALVQACMTIAEATRLGADLYYATDIYEFSKKIIDELSIDRDEFDSLTDKVASSLHLSDTNLSEYNKKTDELFKYEVINI